MFDVWNVFGFEMVGIECLDVSVRIEIGENQLEKGTYWIGIL